MIWEAAVNHLKQLLRPRRGGLLHRQMDGDHVGSAISRNAGARDFDRHCAIHSSLLCSVPAETAQDRNNWREPAILTSPWPLNSTDRQSSGRSPRSAGFHFFDLKLLESLCQE